MHWLLFHTGMFDVVRLAMVSMQVVSVSQSSLMLPSESLLSGILGSSKCLSASSLQCYSPLDGYNESAEMAVQGRLFK